MRITAKGRLSTRPSCRHTPFTHGRERVAPLSREQGKELVTHTSERLRVAEALQGLDQQIDRKVEIAEALMNVGDDRGAE